MWTALAIISGVLLVIFWRSRNAVWGGLTLGIIIGLVIAGVYAFGGHGFQWFTVGKGAIIGVLAGVGAELLGIVSKPSGRQ
jgi:hypothetical protein